MFFNHVFYKEHIISDLINNNIYNIHITRIYDSLIHNNFNKQIRFHQIDFKVMQSPNILLNLKGLFIA